MSEGKSTKTHKLVHDKTGDIINVGDVALDFRGDAHIVQGWTSGEDWSSNGGTGRVHTESGTFYPSVIDCTIYPLDVTDEQIRAARWIGEAYYNAERDGKGMEYLSDVNSITEITIVKLYDLAHGNDMALTVDEARIVIAKIIPTQE